MARRFGSKALVRIVVSAIVLVGILALSLLPVACRQTKTHVRAPDVDSKNLKQTVVVATLDCPLPEHKNAIWCSTFQMAWDKLKQDVIGEPIQVLGAEELANRLNAGPFPTGSIEERSYYAVADFVKNGIIEQIQTEMKRRFPSEPVPIFDGRYKTLPEAIAAYAYLNVNIEFEHPYYTYSGKFEFSGSNGTRTRVKAFGDRITKPDANFGLVRSQVEVLYYQDGDSSADKQFAVDLSRLTHPYQIILACMPRCGTFGEGVRVLRERIAAFERNPDYETLCKLAPRDSLIAPAVVYKLTHHLDYLLGKHLGNPQWTDTFIFEAMQRIDFTLSRTGAVLKSAARGAVAKTAVMAQPRLLHFDRPFLICVQKREANATPFFLMWVDNAELMKK
jgi:hypothetical protein